MYDYLLTVFKLIIGLITDKRLILVSVAAIVFYIAWICGSLTFSFQRKFNRNCVKLYNYVKKKGINANDNNYVDLKASKISSGFSHGWKKFKTSSYGRPSDFITRRDALDVEVSGGVLNQGKTIMRTFVNIVTFALFVANFAYLGNNSTITFYLLAESMVLPLVLYVILKIFYFVYTSVKQQFYKADIECFYELLDLLDSVFAKQDKVVVGQMASSFVQGEDVDSFVDVEADLEPEQEESVQEEIKEEVIEPVQDNQEVEEENVASKYDFFKKKNIDVDKILSDDSSKTRSSLMPYINVDSDYVIKDDEYAVSKTITNLVNGSELLGSMMQDLGSIKKHKKEEKAEAEIAVEEKKEENLQEETTSSVEESEKKEEKVEDVKVESEDNSDPFENLGQFEIAENAQIEVKEENVETQEDSKEDSKEEVQEEVQDDVQVEVEESAQDSDDEEIKLEIPDVEPIINNAPVEEAPAESQDDISEERRESIASVVGGFKAKSKLASGGVVIERNQPISRREKASAYSKNEYKSDDAVNNYASNEIIHLSAENNTDNILNTFRNGSNNYDDYQNYGSGMQNPMYGAGYSAPQYSQGFEYTQGGFNQAPQMSDYGMPNAASYQNVQSQGYDDYSVPAGYDDYLEEYEEEEVDETPVKKPAVKRTKENEPRPRNLKKKESKPVMEDIAQTAKRGRPKKQVFDETVTIKNDKEFDEVLSRAEKLMKKSESGLSASQSKRIEKELKMLMDAMNKYKEGV